MPGINSFSKDWRTKARAGCGSFLVSSRSMCFEAFRAGPLKNARQSQSYANRSLLRSFRRNTYHPQYHLLRQAALSKEAAP